MSTAGEETFAGDCFVHMCLVRNWLSKHGDTRRSDHPLTTAERANAVLGLQGEGTAAEQLRRLVSRLALKLPERPEPVTPAVEPKEQWQKLGYLSFREWRLEDSKRRRREAKLKSALSPAPPSPVRRGGGLNLFSEYVDVAPDGEPLHPAPTSEALFGTDELHSEILQRRQSKRERGAAQ